MLLMRLARQHSAPVGQVLMLLKGRSPVPSPLRVEPSMRYLTGNNCALRMPRLRWR